MRWFHRAFLVLCATFVVWGSAWGNEQPPMSEKETSHLLMNYYRNPVPDQVASLITGIDRLVEKRLINQRAFGSLEGFFYEVFKTNQNRLSAWADVIAGLRSPALRKLLFRLYPVAGGEKAREIMMAKVMADPALNRTDWKKLPGSFQFENRLFRDPDSCWGAYFASGNSKYPIAVLRYAVSPDTTDESGEKVLDLSKKAAQWSLFSISREKPDVLQIMRDFLRTADPEEIKRFFAGVGTEERERILGKEGSVKLAPAKSLMQRLAELEKKPDADLRDEVLADLLQLKASVAEQLFDKDPKYKELSEKVDRAKENYTSVEKTFFEKDPELLKLKAELKTAETERQRLAYGIRGTPIARKDQEIKRIGKQIRHRMNIVPEIVSARRTVQEAERTLSEYMESKVKSSALPKAVELAAVMDYFKKNSGNALDLCRPDITVFAGLYQDLSKGIFREQWDSKCSDCILNILKKENPKADPEKLGIYSKLRTGNPSHAYNWTKAASARPAAEVQDEIFRIAALGRVPGANLDEPFRLLQKRLVPNTFTKVEFLRLWSDLSFQLQNDPAMQQKNRKMFVSELERYILSGKPKGFMVQLSYNYLSSYLSRNEWTPLEKRMESRSAEVDPWLLWMVRGRAAVQRAWEARGGDWGSTVTEKGWSSFSSELALARNCFNKALEIHPDWANPYIQLISVEMGGCTRKALLDAFRSIIRLYPDNFAAYDDLSWALLPRWGGSHDLIRQLALTAMATERYDTALPSVGFDLLGRIAWDYPDSRWQNVYRDPEVMKCGERLFAEYLKRADSPAFSKDDKQFILLNRMLFEMATLRYDAAAETLRKSGIPLSKLEKKLVWNGACVYQYPLVPVFDNVALHLTLFTGKYAKELRAIEKEALDKDPEHAREELKKLIRKGTFSVPERDFLIDLAARWGMGESPYLYNAENPLRKAFLVACREDYAEIVKEMLALGYDYSKYEKYPGEVANLTAWSGSDPELLVILKKCGDPLNRRSPDQKRTPMHNATLSPNAPMVRKLLELGVSPNDTDYYSHTPLQMAVASKGEEVIFLLLAHNPDVDHQDLDGDTALMFNSQVDAPVYILEALARRSKNLNLQNGSRKTALHYAVEYSSDPRSVKVLLDAGASPQIRDYGNRTPWEVARVMGKEEFQALLPPPAPLPPSPPPPPPPPPAPKGWLEKGRDLYDRAEPYLPYVGGAAVLLLVLFVVYRRKTAAPKE